MKYGEKMSVQFATLGDLKKGSYIVIDNEPCRVVEITKAKTGKHGSAKAHVVAVSLFTGQKKTLIAPTDTQVQVPIIEKRNGQVLADLGNNLQVMDMESYDTIEVEKPNDEPELLEKLKPGVEVEYWLIMGKAKIVRIRS
ncbi:translation initiation factor eIF-5A [Caldisphaera lagunensis DSM 15908]|uniref:Translation initiation factor 5A n=2 Tax=Caldisphaera lagunensis TaxID=200415 RepID=L0ACJ0_CALLD|nr:translation initiation factor eIF-5A [Caldisphaera lagunensis DSM 15908]